MAHRPALARRACLESRRTCCRSSRAPPSSSSWATTAGPTWRRSTTPSRRSGPTTARAPACCREQLGRGGRADADRDRRRGDRQLGHDRRRDPAGLPGGTQPPSVYNEADAVYGAAALLKKWGAPQNWPAALVAWNNYPPEIAQVTQLVAQYTQTGQGNGGGARRKPRRRRAPVPSAGRDVCRSAGRRRPERVATVLPNGLAAIPQGAPPAVQEMIAAGNQIIHYPYSYGGGHSPRRCGCRPARTPTPARRRTAGPAMTAPPRVSFVLWGGGLGQSLLGGQVPTSWTLENEGPPGRRAVGHDLRRHLRRTGPHVHRGRRDRARHRPRLTHHPRRHRPALATRLRDRLRALTAARSSPATPKAYDPPPLPRPVSLALPGGDRRLRRLARTLTDAGRDATRVERRARPAGPHHTAVSLFAAAYVRFLDGTAPRPRCPTRRGACARWPPRPDRSPPLAGGERSCSAQLRAAPGPARQLPAGSARRRAHVLRADRAPPSSQGRWLVVRADAAGLRAGLRARLARSRRRRLADPRQPRTPRGGSSTAICRGSTARRRCARSGPPRPACWRAWGPSAASPAHDRIAATARSRRSRCSATAAAGRRFRTSTTAARPTSSCSRSRTTRGRWLVSNVSNSAMSQTHRPHK